MAKTQLTKNMEVEFIDFLHEKKYELATRECAIGMRKKYGIVDILSYHGKSIANGKGKLRTREVTWRCYEIKTSKIDFYSKHKWTFVGDYNFFVVPDFLYEQIKQDIPKGIGCYVYDVINKTFEVKNKSQRKKPTLDPTQIMHDFLVSSTRDARRWVRAN